MSVRLHLKIQRQSITNIIKCEIKRNIWSLPSLAVLASHRQFTVSKFVTTEEVTELLDISTYPLNRPQELLAR